MLKLCITFFALSTLQAVFAIPNFSLSISSLASSAGANSLTLSGTSSSAFTASRTDSSSPTSIATASVTGGCSKDVNDDSPTATGTPTDTGASSVGPPSITESWPDDGGSDEPPSTTTLSAPSGTSTPKLVLNCMTNGDQTACDQSQICCELTSTFGVCMTQDRCTTSQSVLADMAMLLSWL